MKSIATTIAVSTLFAASISLSSCSDIAKIGGKIIHAMAEGEDLSGVEPADTVTIQKKMPCNGQFSHIFMAGGYEVQLIQGGNAINFKGRKVFADNAKITISGDTLYIKGNEDRFCRGTYVISVPQIKSITTAGAADIKAENFQQSANLNIMSAGAADIDIKSSSINDLNITSSGASDIDIKSVLMHNASINTAGAGDIEMQRITADTIRIDVKGAGDFVGSGHCKEFICDINGAGDIDIDKLNVASKK